jgi:hypothetical protein
MRRRAALKAKSHSHVKSDKAIELRCEFLRRRVLMKQSKDRGFHDDFRRQCLIGYDKVSLE